MSYDTIHSNPRLPSELKSSDYKLRQKVVEGLDDEDLLFKIARNDMVNTVRIAAIKKISNQNYLKEIALHDQNSEVKVIATTKIDDEDALIELWSSFTEDWWLRTLVVRRIQKKEYLELIASTDQNVYVRKEALSQISDQSTLFNIAVKSWDKHIEIATAVIPKITDVELLQTLRIMTSANVSQIVAKQLRKIRKLEQN